MQVMCVSVHVHVCVPVYTDIIVGFTTTILGLDLSSEIDHDIPITVLPSLPQLRVKIFPHPSMSLTNTCTTTDSPSEKSLYTKRRSFSSLDTFELLDGEKYVCLYITRGG